MSSAHSTFTVVAVLRRERADRLHHVLDQRRDRERLDVELHLARLDLGEVEDVVDEREQMPAGAQHALERLDLVVPLQVARVLVQHLGDADDGVQRRAQLVRHVGEKLRLVLARRLQLLALLLDLLEQPRVLDGEHRLGSERLQQRNDGLRELARRPCAGSPARRSRAPRAIAAPPAPRVCLRATADPQTVVALQLEVGKLNGARCSAQMPTAVSPSRIRDSRSIRDHGVAHAKIGPRLEYSGCLVELVDRAARIGLRQLDGVGDDGHQHGLEVQGGTDRPADFRRARAVPRQSASSAAVRASTFCSRLRCES